MITLSWGEQLSCQKKYSNWLYQMKQTNQQNIYYSYPFKMSVGLKWSLPEPNKMAANYWL